MAIVVAVRPALARNSQARAAMRHFAVAHRLQHFREAWPDVEAVPSDVAITLPFQCIDEEKYMKARILIATAAAALLPLAVAVAADNDQYGKEKDKSMMPDTAFKKLDANGDGRISKAEAAADSTIVFSSADANGDGYLDSAEWKASTSGKGATSPTPQSEPSPTEEPATTPPPDTETPRQ
jgi:hypothetical protein